MSPYSWFAAERLDALIPDAQWRPLFVGALFKACGRVSWGLGDRRAAGIADCDARAEMHGLGPIRWPDPWPTVDLVVARAMIHADRQGELKRFALSAMRLAFREGRDLGDLSVVQEAGQRVGFDPDDIARAVQDREIRTGLRAANDEALALGVFGVPTILVEDKLFWGDDRLDDASHAASGPQET